MTGLKVRKTYAQLSKQYGKKILYSWKFIQTSVRRSSADGREARKELECEIFGGISPMILEIGLKTVILQATTYLLAAPLLPIFNNVEVKS